MNPTVKRLLYALAEADTHVLPDLETATFMAIAWRADHKTGEATLTDDEITRDVNVLMPAVHKLRAASRKQRRRMLHSFLLDHDKE